MYRNRHVQNDHCENHCEFASYKEDSDRLHSIVTALSSKRLPERLIENVGIRIREHQKGNKRTLDVKDYIVMVTDHVNNIKNARTSIGNTKSTTRPSPNPYNRDQSRRLREEQSSLPAHDNHQFGNQGFRDNNNTRNNYKSDPYKECLFCGRRGHWITGCLQCKHLGVNEILARIKQNGGCTICLKRGHAALNCRGQQQQVCEYCLEKGLPHTSHRILVCYKKPKPAVRRETAAAGRDSAATSSFEEDLPAEYY